jgi:hypothetical protein
MSLESRINRLEKVVGNQPCIACATTPRHFLIQKPGDEEHMRKRLAKHTAECTCGRTFHVKRIILHPIGAPVSRE